MTTPEFFSREPFDLGGFRYEWIGAAPDGHLISDAGASANLKLGEKFGRVQLTPYMQAQSRQIYARLYHIESGAHAWYRVTESSARLPEPDAGGAG